MQQNNEQESRLFNPNEHVMQLKSREGSKDYLPIQWRLVWFRSVCPQGTIDTEEIVVDLDREVEAESFAWNPEKRRSEKMVKRAKGYARYRAVVTDGKGGRATGTKSENAASFPDFAEKAETGAIGRALAALGYGTQFTGDEFNEQERLADAPVERASVQQAQPAQSGRITDSQLKSIRNLCRLLGRSVAEGTEQLSEQNARETIAALSQHWQEKQMKQAAPKTLDAQIKDAKERAERLGIAHDVQEWKALLASLHLSEIKSEAELAKVNGHLTTIERGHTPVTK